MLTPKSMRMAAMGKATAGGGGVPVLLKRKSASGADLLLTAA
jgi:hypothetical protein